jgi:hypothetical protein
MRRLEDLSQLGVRRGGRLSSALAMMASILMWLPQASTAIESEKIAKAIELLERLCLAKGHSTSIEVTGSWNGSNISDQIIGTETQSETAFIITPDRKVKALNEERTTTWMEQRVIALPDGQKLSGNIRIVHRQSGWGDNPIAEDEANKEAACIQEDLNKLTDALPEYFKSSLVTAFSQAEAQNLTQATHNDVAMEFLSNTKMEIVKPELQVFEKGLLQLRLYPPFLLNDLSAALKANFPIVQPYMESKIRISAELLYGDAHDARIQQLSTAEQDLRAFPPTEWFWSVEPLKAGSTGAFIKFTITRMLGSPEKGISFVYPLNVRAAPNPTKTIVKFVLTNWQWILGTVLIPVAIYIFHILWPKKERDVVHNKTAPGRSRRSPRR